MDQGADPWNGCLHGWCSRFSDRFSVCVMSRRRPYYFDMTNGGFVLSPTQLEPTSDSMYCAWAYDAGTMGMGSHGCEGRGHCTELSQTYCWWPPSELKQMMLQQEHLGDECGAYDCKYNELMMNGDFWRSKLPTLIEAMFYPVGSSSGEQHVRQVHADLLRTFGLNADSVPLLELDMSQLDTPFRIQ